MLRMTTLYVDVCTNPFSIYLLISDSQYINQAKENNRNTKGTI